MFRTKQVITPLAKSRTLSQRLILKTLHYGTVVLEQRAPGRSDT